MDKSKGVDISYFGKDFKPIVEMVPNFVDNTPSSPLFEAKVGNADLLFCGFDLSLEDASSKQLIASVCSYVESDEFRPNNVVDEKVFGLLSTKN